MTNAPSITCPTCNMTSYNTNDIEQKYCGNCNEWHSHMQKISRKLDLYKIIRNTNLWKKGQKVWGVFSTGDLSYKCIGRYQGKGRWIMGWVHVDVPDEYTWHHNKPDAVWVGEVDVSEEFYQHYRQIVGKIVKNQYWDVHGI